MKRFFAVIIFLLAFVTAKAGIVEKVYHFDTYGITRTGEFQTFVLEDGLLTGAPGSPALPYFSVSLLLPPGESTSKIEMIGEDETVVPGSFKLYPFQPPYPLSDERKHDLVLDSKVYQSNRPFPAKPFGQLLTQYLNGFGFALSTFTPVKYNAAQGRISFFRKVTIRITTKASDGLQRHLSPSSASLAARERIRDFAQNPGIMSLYPPVTNDTSRYNILIISPDIFAGNFQLLVDLYYFRGMKTRIVTLSEITPGMPGVDVPEKMRNFIIQEYQEHQIEQVILAGDAELIPYRGLYGFVISSPNQEDTNIPGDIYFSALDGNWNSDGDNLWGEPGEEDLLPDISVGRLPVSNAAELANMIHKTISYQNNPVLTDLRNPLLVGEWLYNNPPSNGSTYLKMLVGLHSDSGYTTQGIPPTHPYDTLYDQPAPNAYSWTKATLLTCVNQGHSFIYHLGHSNATYAMRMVNSDITDANFSQINGINHGYMPVYTQGCICGAFDQSDCIGELMVTIQNFAPVFIGNSRYGWFNEGQADGPSLHLQRAFVDALYAHHVNSVGMAHSVSKIMSAPWVTAPGQWEPGALRWVFYDCNVLGDPVMAVWTDQPLNINTVYPDCLPLNSSSLSGSVDTSGIPVQGLRVALLQNDSLVATGITDTTGQFHLNFVAAALDTGQAKLVFSGYNCLPVERTVMVNPMAAVTNASGVAGDASATISWTNPPSCYDEIMVVANPGHPVALSPSGDGSQYSASNIYGNGSSFDLGYVVYKGTGTQVNVTSLVNGYSYYFTVFTRKNNVWSTGNTVVASPNGNYSLDILHVTVSNGINSDETILMFMEGGNDGFDDWDSQKMFSNQPGLPQIYTTIPGAGAMVINTQSALDTSRTIPLGLNINAADTFSIAVNTQDFDAGIAVLLEDQETGITTDMRDTNYTFTSDVVSNSSRFLLFLLPSSIFGDVVYLNSDTTRLAGVVVQLLDTDDAVVQTDTTDAGGRYRFSRVPAGTYHMHVTGFPVPGGINSTDALVVMRYYIGLISLENLKWRAADVNASHTVNSIDALMIQKKFIAMLNVFPAGSWVTDEPVINIPSIGIYVRQRIRALSYGDVNGSYHP